MKYFLWHAVLGAHPRLPLSRSEYTALKDAWETVLALLPFEEEFDGLLQNYIELELVFLNAAMKAMVISRNDMVEFRKVRLTFARHLSNLLSSCRSYLDHSPRHLRHFGDEMAEVFCKRANAAYDSEFAYRFMEALRNYSQHYGSPLHGTTFNTRRVEGDSDHAQLRYSVWASVNVKRLREDKRFKRSVLNEIKGEDLLDVIGLCRIYVEKLGELHGSMRKDLHERISDAKDLLRAALDRYENESGEGRVGISLCRSTSERTVDHQIGIPDDVIDLYDNLVSQNRQVINLRHRFVSNELLPGAKAEFADLMSRVFQHQGCLPPR